MSTTRRSTLVVALPLLAASLVSGCGGGGGQPRPDSTATAAQPIAAPDSTVAAAAVDNTAGQEGYMICQTCHQADGQGIPNTYPPLAGSEVVNGPPEVMIAIVLKGLVGPVTVAGKTFDNVMAPWESLPDDQIAATISYARSSWGNRGSVVTAEQVAKVRAAIASRTTSWTIAELEKANLK